MRVTVPIVEKTTRSWRLKSKLNLHVVVVRILGRSNLRAGINKNFRMKFQGPIVQLLPSETGNKKYKIERTCVLSISLSHLLTSELINLPLWSRESVTNTVLTNDTADKCRLTKKEREKRYRITTAT